MLIPPLGRPGVSQAGSAARSCTFLSQRGVVPSTESNDSRGLWRSAGEDAEDVNAMTAGELAVLAAGGSRVSAEFYGETCLHVRHKKKVQQKIIISEYFSEPDFCACILFVLDANYAYFCLFTLMFALDPRCSVAITVEPLINQITLDSRD